ncbi:MAG TPA: HAMP domain-containing sensor histidine kinase, partial [Candidatus Limnocylindrales bacterium]
DPAGRVLAKPRRVTLAGLPDIAAASAALAHGQDWRTVEAGGVRVRLFSKRVTDGEGNLGVLQSGFVLTLHDEQKRQLLLTIALASLAGLLGAGLVSLLVAQRALSPVREAFAAERRFVAAASHELRTPVAVLRAQAELLQREGLVAPAGQSLVGEMLDEADRLGRLVGDLLALSSAEAGAIVLEPRPIEVRDFVARICARVEGMARERGVPIELAQADEQSDAELTVIADPDRLAQLLLIFIDNAIDHSPPGAAVQLLVRPVLRHGQPYVSIGVADRGPGVPLDQRQQIFEPFTRSRGRPRLSHSTGLGLAIARILASRQGAEIQVDDGDGGGAVFSVLLPRRRPPTGNAQRRETTSRPAALPPG